MQTIYNDHELKQLGKTMSACEGDYVALRCRVCEKRMEEGVRRERLYCGPSCGARASEFRRAGIPEADWPREFRMRRR